MSSIYNLFPQEVVTSIGWTLLHSLWQGGVAALLLYFALYYLRNKNAGIKAFLSASALAVMLIASVVTFAVKYNSILSADNSDTIINLNSADIAALNSAVQDKTADSGILSIAYDKFIHYFNENIPLIVTLWMLGFLFFTIRFTGGVVLTARMRRKIVLIDDEKVIAGLNKLCAKINLKRKVQFAESVLVKVPIVLGYLKPMILLPFGMLSGLPREQIEAIIAHEIAHIKRYDILINLFQSIAEILFFFNPFVWYISYKIRAERENACDDAAINLCGNSLIYAKALANAESFKKSNEPLFAIPLFKNHNQLVRRIKRMLNKDQNQNGFKEKFAAALIFIGILVAASVLKNVNTGASDAQMNKAGILLPSSLFIGDKELSDVVIDTTKASHGKRSFSYFQKEDGKMKRYKAKMKDGELTDLFIDGDKVPQEKLNSYKQDVEEAYKKIELEGYYFGRGDKFRFEGDLFGSKFLDDSMKEFSKNMAQWGEQFGKEMSEQFNSKEFRESMKRLEKELKANTFKWKEFADSAEYRKSMKELQKELRENSAKWKESYNSEESKKLREKLRKELKENSARWKEYSNSGEYKKSMEKLKKEIEKIKEEMKEKKYNQNGEFDQQKFDEKMDQLKEKLEKLTESERFNHQVNLDALKGLDSMQFGKLGSLAALKSLEALKNKDFAMKGFNKGMKDFNVKMKDFGAKMKVFGRFMKEVKGVLVEEKVLEDMDEDVSFNMKKDGVYVDGKKQSDAVFNKVKEIYKKYYNKEYDGNFDLNIK
jgi:bla regulator protein blaR1